MDRRERMNDPEEALRTALDGRQAALWTALPGIIVLFNPKQMTATVQPAIQGQQLTDDGTYQAVSLPVLLDCPVLFPSGGGCTLTFPVRSGDECLVIFASRCIDAWWQSGGVQPQAEFRMHDLSDGFVLVGPRSQPQTIDGISLTSVELRTDAGLTSVSINPLTEEMTLTSPNEIVINAPGLQVNGYIHATGDVDTAGDVHAEGDVTGGLISLDTHVHGGVKTGTDTTTGPI